MAQAEQVKTYDVSAERFLKAVMDYSAYPLFVDGMKQVKVERLSESEVKAHYELSMMKKDMSYSLKIQESPGSGEIRWTLLQSDFFKVNNGAWRVTSIGSNQCSVHYSLEVEFSFSVPSLILKGIVKGSLPTMMNSFYERAKNL